MNVRVNITLKPSVLDSQGKAIGMVLGQLGFEGVGLVRQGKLIDLEIDGTEEADVYDRVDAMCKKMLANPVIEDYTIDILEW